MKTFAYHGEELTIKQIAAREGVQAESVKRRINRYGRAENVRKDSYEYQGEMRKAREIAQAEGITRQAV